MSPEVQGNKVFVAERYLDLLSRSSYLVGERGSAKKKSFFAESECTVHQNNNNKKTRTVWWRMGVE